MVKQGLHNTHCYKVVKYENTRVTHGNPGVTHGDTGVTHGNTGSHLVLQAEVVPRTGKFQALEYFACCNSMASDGVR